MTLPRADLDFLLYDWLDTAALFERPQFAHLERETADSMLDASLQIAAQHFAPHAAKSDANEPMLRMWPGMLRA